MIFVTLNPVLSRGAVVEAGPGGRGIGERLQNPCAIKLLEDVPKLSLAAEVIEGRKQAESLG
jgi:hypothetical protein